MKTLFPFLASAVLLLGTSSAFAQQATWTEDYTKATTQAQAENKAILLDFTGSDWCGWCMKMKKESLDTPQFNAYAKQNLVLVTVDFPRQKVLSPAVKKQNDTLNAKYHADGFPTFVLVDKTGREIWRQSGYLAGGPTAFIAAMGKSYHPAPVQAASADGGDDFDKFFKKTASAPKP